MIINEEAHFIKDLVSTYKSIMVDVGGDAYGDVTFTSQHLQDKLRSFFGKDILFDHGNQRRGNIIYNSKTNLDAAVRKAFENSSDVGRKIRDVALLLRKAITNSDKRILPTSLTLGDIYKGEIDSPELLTDFLSRLIFGYDTWRRESSIKQRRVHSIAQDVIYAATGGTAKPPKQIIMGLAFKSMTGSRRIVEILNLLGHSISYNATEELETELTFSSLEEGRVTPYGMSLNPSLCSGVAFDNFDRFVETATGKDTLHDTVGIAYQDISSNLQEILIEPSPSEINNEYLTVSRKRRRTFECGSLDLEPYDKKPKMGFLSFLPLDDSRRNAVPNRLNHAKLLDNLWMLSIF